MRRERERKGIMTKRKGGINRKEGRRKKERNNE